MKMLRLIIFALLSSSSVMALSFNGAPSVSGYCWNKSGNSWILLATSSLGGNAVQAPPPGVALYGSNGSAYYPILCDANGNLTSLPPGWTVTGSGSTQAVSAPGTLILGALTPTTIGSNGVLLNGVPALQSQTSLNNYYSGGSGNLTGTGSDNTASGFQALSANTTGTANTANGFQALSANTTGSYNTANGIFALSANTTGSDNTASGFAALSANTTGSYNTANGFQALSANTTGSDNTANGFQALSANTTGTANTANGIWAGHYIADGVTANQTSTNSVYDGNNAYPLANGDTNETVIGDAAIGHGSNTTTLGNTTTVGTWLNGTQHITATAPITSAGTIAAYSTNAAGEITGLSAATSVTITFANSGWTNAAFCVANSSVAATQPYVTAQSNTAVTFTFPALTGNLFYHCDGN
jgi:hypothetical protein